MEQKGERERAEELWSWCVHTKTTAFSTSRKDKIPRAPHPKFEFLSRRTTKPQKAPVFVRLCLLLLVLLLYQSCQVRRKREQQESKAGKQ